MCDACFKAGAARGTHGAINARSMPRTRLEDALTALRVTRERQQRQAANLVRFHTRMLAAFDAAMEVLATGFEPQY